MARPAIALPGSHDPWPRKSHRCRGATAQARTQSLPARFLRRITRQITLRDPLRRLPPPRARRCGSATLPPAVCLCSLRSRATRLRNARRVRKCQSHLAAIFSSDGSSWFTLGFMERVGCKWARRLRADHLAGAAGFFFSPWTTTTGQLAFKSTSRVVLPTSRS